MKIKSTKTWHKLPCGHAQWFDEDSDGRPGACSSVHGYDRSVKMTFAGEVDENGWIVPFGDLKSVKKFLEYYFDHTTVIPANDPRLDAFHEVNEMTDPPMFDLRVLPYGVSMEMSSRFIWEHVNPFIMNVTDGRCYVESVESIEHDSNSAYIEVTEEEAVKQYKIKKTKDLLENSVDQYLVMKPEWDYVSPTEKY
jgi:6-pyruvoyl-tetrahydropterin synthase